MYLEMYLFGFVCDTTTKQCLFSNLCLQFLITRKTCLQSHSYDGVLGPYMLCCMGGISD